MNKYVDPPERTSIEIHQTDPAAEKRQIDRLARTRATRDKAQVERLLNRLAQEAADPSQNLMPTTIELVSARATVERSSSGLKAEFGNYVELPVF